MSGWVYLIRNGDLHKIGITQNLEQRMKQLKPDEIVRTYKTENYETLEKQLHRRYRNVRIPQTEYFRLQDWQLENCKAALQGGYEVEDLVDEDDQSSNPIPNWIELLVWVAFFSTAESGKLFGRIKSLITLGLLGIGSIALPFIQYQRPTNFLIEETTIDILIIQFCSILGAIFFWIGARKFIAKNFFTRCLGIVCNFGGLSGLFFGLVFLLLFYFLEPQFVSLKP